MSVIETLSEFERLHLVECESVIGRGLKTFVEVGSALLRIREGRLYRATHRSFADYCDKQWGMSRQRANQLVDAAQTVGNLTTTVVKPTTESQARPLATLEPEQQRVAWTQAVATAPDGRPTGARVAAVAADLFPRPGPARNVNITTASAAPPEAADDEEIDDEGVGPSVLQSPLVGAPRHTRVPYRPRWERLGDFWLSIRNIDDHFGGIVAYLQKLAPDDRDVECVQIGHMAERLAAWTREIAEMKAGVSADDVQSYRMPAEEEEGVP